MVELHLNLVGRRELAGQIYRQIRDRILANELRAGATVPSTRELSGRLGVSRNTVAVAYDRLVAEGFLTSRTGVGTTVNGVPPSARVAADPPSAPLRARAAWDLIPEFDDLSAAAPAYDFRAGIPDAGEFPYAAWRRLVSDELRPRAVGRGAHITPAGLLPLREALARHVAVSRGVRARVEDLIVTSGIQQAADLTAKVLLEPGDTVAVEDPGYDPPRLLFEAAGARVVGVPVDGEGLVVDALPDDARLVYVTPSHQFPLGMAMSPTRRTALLQWAERVGAVIVEDDYDSEFRYAGRPLEPLHSLDPNGRVIYAASFSKVLLPTLRLGFLVVPPTLGAAFRKAKQLTDWHTAVPLQSALARFVDDGSLARHIRRMRRLYAERHHTMRETLWREFDGLLEPVPAMAGLHLSATIAAGGPMDTGVVARAKDAGVGIDSLSRFAIRERRNGLLIGYGGIPVNHIADGLRLLRQCLPVP
ncbi:GntR family transcriptional regulator [Kribbella pratensis]|uniref:GntR family transcriptional regulator n=1 Tax=Kribbella pratensis TaxID=2512112 RepID=A0ABY2FPB9_9ACTN|nr:GntR family transcriptional regulator [Kribbella pratensis]